MTSTPMRRTVVVAFLAAGAFAGFSACVEPPPKIAAIPASGLSLRLHVFGADAEDALRSFESVKENNKTFAVVPQGGDGEVLIGLENDLGGKCVEPTALCEFRVSYRIKNAQGEVIHAETATISANATSCTMICPKALNNVASKIVESAAAHLKGGAPPVESASAEPVSSAKAKAPKKPVKADPVICNAGTGPRLPSEEAEKRAAQVEALKRIGVLDQTEYDCLRKAYLARL
jgi:hypothetical protein